MQTYKKNSDGPHQVLLFSTGAALGLIQEPAFGRSLLVLAAVGVMTGLEAKSNKQTEKKKLPWTILWPPSVQRQATGNTLD